MKLPALETERVRLRPLEADDVPAIVAFHNDLELKYLTLSWPLPVSRRKVADWLEETGNNANAVAWGIEDARSGELIGVARLMNIRWDDRAGEVGLYVHDAGHRGHGLGGDALQLLRDWATAYLGLQRLFARVLAGNEPAIRTFASAGFEQEGVLRRATYRLGRYHDVIHFAFLTPPATEAPQ